MTIIENKLSPKCLKSSQWQGSCVGSESTLHQLSPYIGKMKSTMAKQLIRDYSKKGDLILDPFVGSGVVALESLIEGRSIIAGDINPYAIILTKGKLEAPLNLDDALIKVDHYLKLMRQTKGKKQLEIIPDWVQEFFHPKTLAEIIQLNTVLSERKEYFLQSCLLGILHHQRPGFLSFPSSHLVPYLRTRAFPKDRYPELYEYRAVEPRLKAKIRRVYRRFPEIDPKLYRACYQGDAARVQFKANTIDAVITSPPYMNALDYARDNRLRLWFLGVNELEKYDERIDTEKKFIKLMMNCLLKLQVAVKTGGNCVFVLGEVKTRNKETIVDWFLDIINRIEGFKIDSVFKDKIPDIRRSRRDCRGTKREWIIVLRKDSQNGSKESAN